MKTFPKFIGVRMSAPERTALEALANQRGQTLSATIRAWLAEQAKQELVQDAQEMQD